MLQAAFIGGPAFDLDRENHLTLHGEAGVSTHLDLGDGFFRDNRGGETVAVLPYVGVRLAVTHGVFDSRWVAGLALHLRRELGERTNTVIAEDHFFGTTSTETYLVGGSYLGLNLTMAVR